MTAAAPDRYAVVGHPVAHSRSPQIHALFAVQTGEPVVYERLLAPLDGFAPTVLGFFARGGRGLNVTVPFKQAAHAQCGRLTSRADQAGAVNTLWREDGVLVGDNTDGVGLLRDLQDNLGVAVQGARVLLLGAGGAARGVLGPLVAAGAREVVIVNRTHANAETLAAHFGAPCVARAFPHPSATGFDLVINATSAGLTGDLPPMHAGLFNPNACAYDLLYGEGPTPFLVRASALGAARTADGLGMLVEQAAEAFAVWRGVRPRTAGVIAEMRRIMQAAER